MTPNATERAIDVYDQCDGRGTRQENIMRIADAINAAVKDALAERDAGEAADLRRRVGELAEGYEQNRRECRGRSGTISCHECSIIARLAADLRGLLSEREEARGA